MRPRPKIPRTDWFRILVDLQNIGWNNAVVANTLDIPRSTIIGWKGGSEPNHHDGTRLLELWQDMTGSQMIPTVADPTKVGIPTR